VREAGVDEATFAEVVGRISFFVNAGMRFITEICKLRAFAELWDEITPDATASRTRRSACSATACR
jgi:(2R)-ethylmalonyl-CoA mutase